MEYHCSRCHKRFSAAADATQSEHGGDAMRCPRCKAEAGLEPVKGAPLPMILFAVFLASAEAHYVTGTTLMADGGRGYLR